MRLVAYNPFYSARWNNWETDEINASPSVNITEKDHGFFVDVVSPGMNKEDFKIELNNKYLTIAAEKKHEAEQKTNDKVLQKEYSLTSFKRSFYLPDSIKGDGIEANYEHGILKVFIPKKAEVIPATRTIEIQ